MVSTFFRKFLAAARSRQFWLALLVPAVAVALLLILPRKSVRWADIHLGFWIFALDFLAILGSVVALRRSLLSWLRANLPPVAELALIAVVAAGALALDLTCVEARHRVQSDESVFLAAAQNMYHNQTSATCDEGIFRADGSLDCLLDTPTFKARGQSAIWAVLMPFLGTDLRWIFKTQSVLLVLTLLALYLAVRFWTKNGFLALVTSAFFGFMPMTLFQFRSTSVEPLYVFLSAVSLLALHYVLADRSDEPTEPAEGRSDVRTALFDLLPFVLLGAVLGLFAQTRQETVFALFAFALAALPCAMARPRRWWAFLVSLTLFSLPVLLTIAHFRGYNFQGGEYAAHGHFLENLKIDWGIMTADMEGDRLKYPFLSGDAWMALGGLVALVALCFKNAECRKWALFLLVYHLQTYMILENVSGDFTIEINQRYALVFLPTMAFLIAVLLDAVLMKWLPALLSVPKGGRCAGVAMAAAVVCVAASLGIRHNVSLKENIMYNRNHLTTEEREIHRWMATLPGGKETRRLFVYNRPWHFVGYGISGIQFRRWSDLGEGRREELLKEFGGEVYYVRGLYCWENKTYHRKAVESRDASVCDNFEKAYPMEEVFSTTITNNYPLVIFRLAGRSDAERILAGRPEGKIRNPSLSAEGGKLVLRAEALAVPEGSRLNLLPHSTGVPTSVDLAPEGGELRIELPLAPGPNFVSSQIVVPGKPVAEFPTLVFFDPENSLRLTEQKPLSVKQGWGSLGVGESVGHNPLRVKNAVFADGFGSHADGALEFAVPPGWTHVAGAAGLDDEEFGGNGATFSIKADGRVIWSSGPMRHGALAPFRVQLGDAKRITLEANGNGNIDFDHADWLFPTLTR